MAEIDFGTRMEEETRSRFRESGEVVKAVVFEAVRRKPDEDNRDSIGADVAAAVKFRANRAARGFIRRFAPKRLRFV